MSKISRPESVRATEADRAGVAVRGTCLRAAIRAAYGLPVTSAPPGSPRREVAEAEAALGAAMLRCILPDENTATEDKHAGGPVDQAEPDAQ